MKNGHNNLTHHGTEDKHYTVVGKATSHQLCVILLCRIYKKSSRKSGLLVIVKPVMETITLTLCRTSVFAKVTYFSASSPCTKIRDSAFERKIFKIWKKRAEQRRVKRRGVSMCVNRYNACVHRLELSGCVNDHGHFVHVCVCVCVDVFLRVFQCMAFVGERNQVSRIWPYGRTFNGAWASFSLWPLSLFIPSFLPPPPFT